MNFASRPFSICIVDYGMGNVGSVQSAFTALKVASFISDDRRQIEAADAYVLPGVGAFGEAMANLRRLDLVAPLTEQVVNCGKPFLGICLGMQLLAEDSHEFGYHRGLAWLPGAVVPMPHAPAVRVPHVGWSEVDFTAGDELQGRIAQKACFYFDHSFYLETENDLVTATATSGTEFAAAVRRDNIMAVQFHPEKSQRNGLRLLRNFSNLCATRAVA